MQVRCTLVGVVVMNRKVCLGDQLTTDIVGGRQYFEGRMGQQVSSYLGACVQPSSRKQQLGSADHLLHTSKG